MSLTNEQLYSQIAALDVTNKEFRDATLTMLGKLVRSNELSISGRESFRQTVGISASVPIILDYRDRKHVYLFSANALTLTLEDLGTLSVSANTWVDISFRPGLFIYALNQVSIVYVTIVQTDETIASNASGGGGGGTQYTDGNTSPANPTGNSIVFDNSGAWADVGADAPLPVTVFGLPPLPAGTNTIGSVNVANVNANGQNTMANSSPVVIASNQSNVPTIDSARQASINAAAYLASYGRLTVATQTTSGYPLSIFNSGASKNCVITQLRVELNGGAGEFRLATTTVDPAYANAATEQPLSLGSAASGLSLTYDTAVHVLPGTFFEDIQLQNNTPWELIQAGTGILLPKGSTNGITIWAVPSGAGSSIISLKYYTF